MNVNVNLNQRQKILLGLIAVVVVVLLWQIYELIGSGGAGSPASSVSTNVSTNATPAASPGLSKPVMQYTLPENADHKPLNAGNTPAASANADQQKYLQLVNEYQMVEMQKMIAEDQAAIAKARADAAQSMSSIGKITGNTDDMDNNLGSSYSDSNNGSSGNYSLIYTGQDNGQWTATVKKNGQYNDVTAGSILPDGAKVLSVDDNGVLIMQGDVKKLIGFNGMTQVSADADAASPAKPSVNPAVSSPIVKSPPTPVHVPTPPAVQKAVVLQKPVTPVVAAPVVKTPPKAPVENKPVVKTEVITNAPVTKPVIKPVVAAKPAVKPPAPVHVATQSQGAFNIMTANKNFYTVQLIADKDIGAVNDFIADNKFEGKAVALKTLRDDDSWYIGVYGEYPSVEAAMAAIRALPEDAKSEAPFVRKISAVQSQVEK